MRQKSFQGGQRVFRSIGRNYPQRFTTRCTWMSTPMRGQPTADSQRQVRALRPYSGEFEQNGFVARHLAFVLRNDRSRHVVERSGLRRVEDTRGDQRIYLLRGQRRNRRGRKGRFSSNPAASA